MKNPNLHLSIFFANLFFIGVFFTISSCNLKPSDKKPTNKLSFSNAVDYNDFIFKEQEGIVNSAMSLSEALQSGRSDIINIKYKKFGSQAKHSLDNVKLMDAFNGNTSLRDEATRLFQFYFSLYQNEYKEMIRIILKNDNISTKSDKLRLSEIQQQVAIKESRLDSAFAIEQSKFAVANNMQIMQSEMQNKIDSLNNKNR